MTTSAALTVIDGQRGETLNAAVARRLRGKLAEHQISASEVARKVGMTQAAMSRRTNGHTPIDLNELQAICEATNFDMHHLLTGENPHPAGPNGGVSDAAATEQAPNASRWSCRDSAGRRHLSVAA